MSITTARFERITAQVPVPQYQCVVWLERDLTSPEAPEVLMWRAAGEHNGCPVVHPPSQQFLDEVNCLFHTSFSMEHFNQGGKP